jgi:hypothetical protein
MSLAPAWPQYLTFFGTPLVIEPSPGQLSGDAGLVPIRPFMVTNRAGASRYLEAISWGTTSGGTCVRRP